MMIVKKATDQSKAAQARKREYTWLAVAALIVTLILALAAVPQAAALESTERGESEPSQFSSQAEAIEYYLAELEREPDGGEAISFSSQAEAIDYYVAMAESEREAVAAVSFSSQAEAIEYYLTQHQCELEAAAVSFTSQTQVIEYYEAMAEREREGLASLSSSEACSLVN